MYRMSLSPKRYFQLGWQIKAVFFLRLAGKSCWMALGQYEHIDNQVGDAMDLWPDFVRKTADGTQN
jgi:hypothetical protein